MKTITKFQAIDGVEFYTDSECLNYERLICAVENIMGELEQPPDDKDCKFANGDGFIQHDKVTLSRVRIDLLKEIKKHIDHKWVQQSIDDESIHPSWVARLISDYNIRPLSNAWYRFQCIDVRGREWGQPYFANNPEKATEQSRR